MPVNPQSESRSTALITGASTGIGFDLAHLFAADGHNVVLVARSGDKLGALAAELESKHRVRALAVPIDLSDPAAPEELHHLMEREGITVDVLVNNAGFGAHGPFVAGDPEQQLQLLQVNVVALTHLTRLFLPPMIARRKGRVLNVASTAAFLPGPLMAVYFASKAYVLSFSEAVDAEAAGTGVTVTALCPGPTITEFQKRAGMENSALFRANTMTSADVARIGYRGMLKGKRVVVAGAKNKAMTFSLRFAPRRLVTAIAKKLNDAR